MSPLHCETQTTRENLFFAVPIITLKMFGGLGASTKAKTQVISICTLFSGFSN